MRKFRSFFEFVKEPLLLVLVILFIQSFVFMHINIPSESMVSTIEIGDHLIVNCLPMYYRDPQIGEIIVFKEGNVQMIKRVIAGPGDVVDIRLEMNGDLEEGYVYVNGQKLDEEAYLEDNGATYPYIYSTEKITFPLTVPENQYFMMGDNRLRSADSRDFGTVSRDAMVGTARLKIYPFSDFGLIK